MSDKQDKCPKCGVEGPSISLSNGDVGLVCGSVVNTLTDEFEYISSICRQVWSDKIVAQLSVVTKERDRCLKDIDRLIIRCDGLEREKDSALKERDDLKKERDHLKRELKFYKDSFEDREYSDV